MKPITFSELRNHARKYFDKVEQGETLEIYRRGKPVALLIPAQTHGRRRSWRDTARPLEIPGVSLAKVILAERDEKYGK